MFTDLLNPYFPVQYRQRLFDIAVQGFDKPSQQTKDDYIKLVYSLIKPSLPENWKEVAKQIHATLVEEAFQAVEQTKAIPAAAIIEEKKSVEGIQPAPVKPVYVAPAATENSLYLNALMDIEAHFSRPDIENRMLFLFFAAYQFSFFEFNEEKQAAMGALFKRTLMDNVDATVKGDSSYAGYSKSLFQYIG